MSNKLVNKLKSIYALTRIQEYFDFNFTLGFLGLAATRMNFSWNFVVVILANLLGLAFAFMINDIEDAKEDAQDPKKFKRNPIANKSLTKQEGYLYTNVVFILSLLLYGYLSLATNNILPLLFGIILLLIDFLYSYRKVRLKKYPVLDLITHSYMLAGGQFLVAYFSYSKQVTLTGALLFLAVVAFSMYGELDNELKDYEIDCRTGIKTTVAFWGKKFGYWLQIFFVILGIAGVLTVLWQEQISLLLLLQGLVIIVIFLSYPLFRFLFTKNNRNWKTDLHRAVLFASNICLLLFILNFHK